MSQGNQFAQLLRAAVAQGRRFQQAHPRDRKTGQQTRVGRCVCGALVASHYDSRNQFVGCAHVRSVGA